MSSYRIEKSKMNYAGESGYHVHLYEKQDSSFVHIFATFVASKDSNDSYLISKALEQLNN